MRFYVLVLTTIIFLSCNSNNRGTNNIQTRAKDSIENELLMLKNQAFCNLYNQVTKGRTCNTKDGSSYFQISNLGINYFTSESLQKIVNRWAAKEYKAYEPSDKLYLMKALDFYHSKELNKYIDSIRQIEYGKLEKTLK